MPTYRLTPDAQSDLIELRRFTVKQWGITQSQKYTLELRKTLRLLAENPSLGKLRSDIRSNIFSFPYASHVIYYRIHEKKLIVFSLLHKRMVPLNHLADRNIV